jgi:hypothetical protein
MPTLIERIQFAVAKASIVHVVIGVLAAVAIGKNIYNYFMFQSGSNESISKKPATNQYSSEMQNLMWDRMSNYVIMSAVGLGLYLFFKHLNDKAERQQGSGEDEVVQDERKKIQEEVDKQYGNNESSKKAVKQKEQVESIETKKKK